MANKTTVALTEEQYYTLIEVISNGIEQNDIKLKPNPKVATILMLEANLGLRLSDILSLRLCDIIKDGNRYRLDIVEQKTSKKRKFTVPLEIYSFIQDYALENGIGPRAKLFRISERGVQKCLKKAVDAINYENIGSHSFRKFFATSIYEENNYNIEMVRILLQHSSVAVTQRYLGVQQKEIEDALQKHIKLGVKRAKNSV